MQQRTTTVLVCKIDAAKRIIKGPVLRPEMRDRQGTIISADVIEDAAHNFMLRMNAAKDGTKGGLMHVAIGDGRVQLVETWITDHDDVYGLDEESVEKAAWTTAYINDLPDSAFLHIESGGEKDDGGKTTPRSLRHFPVYDDDGKLDLAHLRNAIAQAPKSKLPKAVQQRVQVKARRLLFGAVRKDEAVGHGEVLIPAGTWMAGAWVPDDETWEGTLDGKYLGFSIGGEADVIYGDD